MNAIAKPETQDQRRTRQMGMCQELAELGMDLARAAQREALSELEAPIEHRMPGMGAPPTCRAEQPGVLFTKFAHAVRQAILLENRIAEGPPQAQQAASPHDSAPRHRDIAPAESPHQRLVPDRMDPLEDDLAADTHRAVPDILAAVHTALHPDHARGQTSYPGLPELQPPADPPIIERKLNRLLFAPFSPPEPAPVIPSAPKTRPRKPPAH